MESPANFYRKDVAQSVGNHPGTLFENLQPPHPAASFEPPDTHPGIEKMADGKTRIIRQARL